MGARHLRISYLTTVALAVLLLAGATAEATSFPTQWATVEGVVTRLDHDRRLIELMGGLVVIDAAEAPILSVGPLRFSDIEVGMYVWAGIREGSYPEGTPMRATVVRLDGYLPLRMTGLVESVSVEHETLVIAGRTFAIRPWTEVTTSGPPTGRRTIRDLRAGQKVSIEAVPVAGILVVRSVMILDVARTPSVRFHATVVSIDASHWRFAGTNPLWAVVAVNSTTRITGSPAVGSEVMVAAVRQADGSYLATEIAVLAATPEETIHGRIVEMTAEYWKLEISGRKTMRMYITADTQIAGTAGVGKLVEVTYRTIEGRPTAIRVHVFGTNAPQPNPTASYVGRISELTADELVLTGPSLEQYLFTVTPRTRFEGRPEVGNTVSVDAEILQSGTLDAVFVRKLSSTPTSLMTVVGAVMERGDDRWVVGRWTILLSPRTTVSGDIDLTDRVRVIGERQADSRFVLAHNIHKE